MLMAYESSVNLYEEVARSDVLDVSEQMMRLPHINAELTRTGSETDKRLLISLFAHIIEKSRALTNVSQIDALAILREADMVRSSLNAFNVDAAQEVIGSDESMLHMGTIAGTVPRMLVGGYTVGNFEGAQRRKFTDIPAPHDARSLEDIFIDGLTASYRDLETGMLALSEIILLPENEPSLIDALYKCASGIKTMGRVMGEIMKQVPIEVFTNQLLRRFFGTLIIDGKIHKSVFGNHGHDGSNGGQLPFDAGIEQEIWPIDSDCPPFAEENTVYLMPSQRAAVKAFASNNRNKTVHEYVLSQNPSTVKIELLKAMHAVCLQTVGFRKPHEAATKMSFANRPINSTGSGGFKFADVQKMTGISVQRLNFYQEAIQIRERFKM